MLILCNSLTSYASDVITLKDQKTFQGKITAVKNCKVAFKAEGVKYFIPATAVKSIIFADPTSKISKKFFALSQSNGESCLRGKLDAEAHHGKKFSHFALGVVFGPFAVFGVALANPTPYRGKYTTERSDNKEYFDDPYYLECYRKKAKNNLLINTSVGWLAWIIFALSFSA